MRSVKVTTTGCGGQMSSVTARWWSLGVISPRISFERAFRNAPLHLKGKPHFRKPLKWSYEIVTPLHCCCLCYFDSANSINARKLGVALCTPLQHCCLCCLSTQFEATMREKCGLVDRYHENHCHNASVLRCAYRRRLTQSSARTMVNVLNAVYSTAPTGMTTVVSLALQGFLQN